MKFTCTQEKLSEGLGAVAKAISSNNTLPVLDNVLLSVEGNILHLTATDLEISINTFIEIEKGEEGAITVPAKLLVQYVSLLPHGAKVECEMLPGETLSIVSPTSKTKIKGINAEEFPIIPPVEDYFYMNVERAHLLGALVHVLFSTSSNTSRPILSGVYFSIKEKLLYLVSTDSFRLSEKKVAISNMQDDHELNMIVPAKSLYEVLKVFANEDISKITIHVAKNQVMFQGGNTKLTSRLIEGQFPNYAQIIPAETKTEGGISKEQFLLSLKRINLFAKENNSNVKFEIKPSEQKILMTTDSTQIGEDVSTIDMIDAKGEDMSIALNVQYIIDMLNNVDADHVYMNTVSETHPAVFKPQKEGKTDDNSYLHLIMPLRV